jgi:hypothetical protein
MRDIWASAGTPAPIRTGTPRELRENALSALHQMKRTITDGC